MFNTKTGKMEMANKNKKKDQKKEINKTENKPILNSPKPFNSAFKNSGTKPKFILDINWESLKEASTSV